MGHSTRNIEMAERTDRCDKDHLSDVKHTMATSDSHKLCSPLQLMSAPNHSIATRTVAKALHHTSIDARQLEEEIIED